MDHSSANIRVLIATTEGPLDVVFLDREPELIEESFVVLSGDRFTRWMPLSQAYSAFVSRKTGLIGRLYNHDTFRLTISGRIDDGFSWQLGVLIAHALEAEGRLAEGDNDAKTIIFATGEIGWGDLRVNKVGFVERKLTEAFARLKAERATGHRVICIWPRDNREDAAPRRVALAVLGIEVIEAETAADALVALGLAVPKLERVMAATASQPHWTGSPFRGLEVFDTQHRPVFFGRGQAREEALKRLRRAAARDCAFLLIYSNSGSGKSSLVRAGLLGDIAEFASEARVWRQAIVVAGRAEAGPIGVLAEALLAAVPELELEAAALSTRLRAAPNEVADDLKQALKPGTAVGPEKLVLVIDQLEDLLLWDRDQAGEAVLEEHHKFVLAIDALARCGAVWVIATLRSDLLPLLEESPAWLRLASDERRYTLSPPSRAELREIVQRPAEMAGLRLEGKDETGLSLADVLVEAVTANADSLPLLQFALARLYDDEGGSGKISIAAYERMGAIEGAIGRHADATIQRLGATPDLERAVEDVLLALGRTDRERGRVVARSARLDVNLATLERRRVVTALEAARLVVKTSQKDPAGSPATIVRVAHEALLTHWPLAQQVFKDHAGLLDLRDRLQTAAEEWLKQTRDETYLLRAGRQLTAAQDLMAHGRVGLSPATSDFINASAEKAESERLAEAERTEAAQAALEQRRLEREAEQGRQLSDARAMAGANQRVIHRTRLGLVASLILAGAAAGFGVYARHQKVRAELAVSKAITTANTLVFDLALKFGNEKGMPIELVKSILDKALKLESALMEGGESTKDLRRSRATAFVYTADTLLSLGASKDALSKSTEAITILRDLLKDGPDRSISQNLAAALDELGSVDIELGELSDAKASLDEALQIHRKAADDQTDSVAQLGLANTLDDQGRLKMAFGNEPGARKDFAESLDIRRKLARNKADRVAQSALGFALHKVGALLWKANDQPGALANFEEELAILRTLAGNSSDQEVQRQLAHTLGFIGDIRSNSSGGYVFDATSKLIDMKAARAAYREGVSISETLAQDKNNLEAQLDLALDLRALGDFELGDRSKTTEAQAAIANPIYEESLGVIRPYQNSPNVRVQMSIVDSLVDAAKYNTVDASIKYYTEAKAILERLDREGHLSDDDRHRLTALTANLVELNRASNRDEK